MLFLLDLVALVRSMIGDGGLGGQEVRIRFSTWSEIVQSEREREEKWCIENLIVFVDRENSGTQWQKS